MKLSLLIWMERHILEMSGMSVASELTPQMPLSPETSVVISYMFIFVAFTYSVRTSGVSQMENFIPALWQTTGGTDQSSPDTSARANV